MCRCSVLFSQEALRVDELAAKVETLTKVLGEREAQNVTLTSKLEELERENDQLRRRLEAGGQVSDEGHSEKVRASFLLKRDTGDFVSRYKTDLDKTHLYFVS